MTALVGALLVVATGAPAAAGRASRPLVVKVKRPGSIEAGVPARLKVTVRNAGSRVLTGLELRTKAPERVVATVSGGSTRLKPGQRTRFTVKVRATAGKARVRMTASGRVGGRRVSRGSVVSLRVKVPTSPLAGKVFFHSALSSDDEDRTLYFVDDKTVFTDQLVAGWPTCAPPSADVDEPGDCQSYTFDGTTLRIGADSYAYRAADDSLVSAADETTLLGAVKAGAGARYDLAVFAATSTGSCPSFDCWGTSTELSLHPDGRFSYLEKYFHTTSWGSSSGSSYHEGGYGVDGASRITLTEADGTVETTPFAVFLTAGKPDPVGAGLFMRGDHYFLDD